MAGAGLSLPALVLAGLVLPRFVPPEFAPPGFALSVGSLRLCTAVEKQRPLIHAMPRPQAMRHTCVLSCSQGASISDYCRP